MILLDNGKKSIVICILAINFYYLVFFIFVKPCYHYYYIEYNKDKDLNIYSYLKNQ